MAPVYGLSDSNWVALQVLIFVRKNRGKTVDIFALRIAHAVKPKTTHFFDSCSY